MAEQYYPIIYKYLVEDLQADSLCAMIGVCGNKTEEPIAPLMSGELAVKTISKKVIGEDKKDAASDKVRNSIGLIVRLTYFYNVRHYLNYKKKKCIFLVTQ